MQKIGIGYENYKEFIDQEMYYVDKTSLISDIVEKGGIEPFLGISLWRYGESFLSLWQKLKKERVWL